PLPLIFRLKPQMIILSRMQLWPLLFVYARFMKIPVYMVSANLQGTSFNSSWKQVLLRCWLNSLQTIFLENEADMIKAQKMKRRKEIQTIPWIEPFCKNHPILTLGSVWMSDLQIILPDVKKLIAHHGFKVILVPHEFDESYLIKDIPYFLSKDRAVKSDAVLC